MESFLLFLSEIIFLPEVNVNPPIQKDLFGDVCGHLFVVTLHERDDLVEGVFVVDVFEDFGDEEVKDVV